MIHTIRHPIPEIVGDYVNIYAPPPAVYEGEDTPSFKGGRLYPDWITNDFTLVRAQDGIWHAFGITHPRPPGFTDHCNFDEHNIHEAEYQLYHATSARPSLSGCMYPGSFAHRGIILYPAQRPGERRECWAPCALQREGVYHLIYSPGEMRYATSHDFSCWKPGGVLFTGPDMMRDPYVFLEDGIYYMIYVEEHLMCRTSRDLFTWSEARVFQRCPFGAHSSAQESPCLIKREGVYYLFWCIHDGTNGCYDDRTFVFASPTLDGFDGLSPLTMLRAHAGEVVQDGGEWYIVSAHYPHNGMNMAPLRWVGQ